MPRLPAPIPREHLLDARLSDIETVTEIVEPDGTRVTSY